MWEWARSYSPVRCSKIKIIHTFRRNVGKRLASLRNIKEININLMIYRSITKINSILLLIVFTSCIGPLDEKELKLAHGLPIDHPVHQAMEFMGQRVRELSEGKLDVTVYPSEQLGSEQQCVELVQIGSLAITKVSAAVMESFIEDYKVL